LGKHLPVAACRCRLAGLALALKIAGDPRADVAQQTLLGDDVAAMGALVHDVETRPAVAVAQEPYIVIGMAETATALGEQVASGLDAAWFATTTRQEVDHERRLAFDEVHSHAPSQWVLVPHDGLPGGVLAIVDDELTTGATAAALIAVLHARSPRERYVVAALVDGRDGADKLRGNGELPRAIAVGTAGLILLSSVSPGRAVAYL